MATMYRIISNRLVFVAFVAAFCTSSYGDAPLAGYFETIGNSEQRTIAIHFYGDAEWLAAQDAPLSDFTRFTQLRKLLLSQHTITEAEMEYITTLKGIRELQVGVYPDLVKIENDALSQIGRIDNLTDLSFYAIFPGHPNWKFFSSCRSLRVLEVDGVHSLNDTFLQNITRASKLQELHVYTDASFTDNGIRSLSSMIELHSLTISSRFLTDRAIEVLLQLPNLRELTLNAPLISDGGIRRLNASPKIFRLKVTRRTRDSKELHGEEAADTRCRN